MVAQPEKRISDVELLTSAERQLLVEEWNATAAPYPSDRCIHQLFEEQAARTPDASAIRCGGRRLSYAELDARAERLADHLRSRGVGPESLVGVLLQRTPELPVALLGILKAGGAYVPLDPSYPRERLAFMLEDAGARFLVTMSSLREGIGVSAAETVCLDDDGWEQSDPAVPPRGASPRPENLAYVIYTSGSTGRPKGVAIEHRNVVALAAWAQAYFRPSDLAVVLASTSVCFDISVFEFFVTLASGGTVVLVDSILALPELPVDAGVTLVNTVPSALAELLRLHPLPPSVRVVNLAGEPLKQALVDEIYRQETVERVYDLYGPTEDTVYSTATLRVPGGVDTIGRPIANTQAFVLDRNLHLVPVGVAGELCLTGHGLARGYLGRPELTAERFVEHALATGPRYRLYRTGDLARVLADGTIALSGRMDHQVKLRGYRIELGEIESVLLACPTVDEAVVTIRQDALGEPLLVGYVVAKDGASVQDMRRHLEARLPAYMVPSALVDDGDPAQDAERQDRPQGASGADVAFGAAGRRRRCSANAHRGVRHRDLGGGPRCRAAGAPRELLRDRRPLVACDPSRVARPGCARSRGAASRHLREADHRGVRGVAERADDRLQTCRRPDGDAMGREHLAMSETTDSLPSLRPEERARLEAGLLQRRRAARAADAIPLRATRGPCALSFAQERLWFVDRFLRGSPAYNIAMALHLRGRLEIAALEKAIGTLVARHESLRTTFAAVDGEPVQVIAPVLAVPVGVGSRWRWRRGRSGTRRSRAGRVRWRLSRSTWNGVRCCGCGCCGCPTTSTCWRW